ncbi:exocyst complex component EXO70H1-like [Curcuma longa]|uniref:exocyst complex component EXO70H1-like n=1 Tax=Curcuma longa TaxID=136217 RepID=UPI003D9F03E9
MPRMGMRSLLPSYSFGRHGHSQDLVGSPSPAASPRPPPQASSHALMAEYMAAEAVVARWRPGAKNAFLFDGDRAEALEFLAAVRGVHRAMLQFASAGRSPEVKSALVSGQTLLQSAMGRLEEEFYRILAANRDRLDPESVSTRSSTQSSVSEESEEEEVRAAGDSIREVENEAAAAMEDLRAIADTMISVGYGKECVRVYKVLRKSIVDEGLYRLGFELLAPNSHVHKLDWPLLEIKIRSWLAASHVAVTTLFAGERILLDHIFSGFDTIREAVFVDVAGEAAREFLRFPDLVTKSKRSTEKVFWILELYEAVSKLLPEINTVFSFVSTEDVRDQALTSLTKLAEVVRATLADFEAALHKEHSKVTTPGVRIHPLTRRAMKYIAELSDHDSTLAEIYAVLPFQKPGLHPDFFFDASDSSAEVETRTSSLASSFSFSSSSSTSSDSNRSGIAGRLAWLILVLLCKLDSKAAAYRDAAQSYLFLANNLQFIVNTVRHCRLRGLLGEEWVAQHAVKARQYAARYEMIAWVKVAAEVPAAEVSAEEARERMRAFVAAVEAACATQAGWVVTDAGMREEVREAVRGMVLPAYRGFYQRWRAALEEGEVARFSPEVVRRRLAELFSGSNEIDSS